MNKFDKWFQGINEELNTVADVTVADTKVAPESDRNNMIGDIDNIMTSLETLASELTEELSIELEVNEGAGDMVMSFINGMKASKAQAKVNKIKMNAADLEFAADKFDGDKKKSIKDKSTKVGQQAKDLQKMVDDRFSGKGNYVDSKLHKAKIEGQIAIIKRTSGMEDDPSKKSDMKTKMSELTNKYKEESKALKELEDGEKEALAKAKEDLADAPKEDKTDDKTDDENKTPEGEKEPTKTDKELADEAAAKKEEERVAGLSDEDKAAEKTAKDAADKKKEEERVAGLSDEEKEAEKAAKDAADKKKEEERVAGLSDEEKEAEKAAAEKTKQAELLTGYKEELKKAQDAGEEEKAKEIQVKIDAISQKESWQFEGTELAKIYESDLNTLKNQAILNESKYLNLSIKDKFSRLL